MVDIRQARPEDLEVLAALAEARQAAPEHHIPYLGEDRSSIAAARALYRKLDSVDVLVARPYRRGFTLP